MSKNLEMAAIFRDMADILAIKGENPFKVRAYRRAAATLEGLSESIESLHATGRLASIPTFGKAITKKIEEWLTTGHLDYYERISATVPRGLTDLLRIPGMSPKTVGLVYERLGITNLDQLEEAARAHRLASLARVGSKTEANILRWIWHQRGQQSSEHCPSPGAPQESSI